MRPMSLANLHVLADQKISPPKAISSKQPSIFSGRDLEKEIKQDNTLLKKLMRMARRRFILFYLK